MRISTASLSAGTVGTPYGDTLVATGGTPDYTWSISSGALPPGLVLKMTSGQISGTPSQAGTYSFGVQVTDCSSPAQTSAATLSLTVNGGAQKGILLGAFLQVVTDSNGSNTDMETWQRKNNATIKTYANFRSDLDSSGQPSIFNTALITRLNGIWNSQHSVPDISLGDDGAEVGCSSRTCPSNYNQTIADGTYDTYLNRSAQDLKAWLAGPDGIYGNADDRRVYLEFCTEMNGDWNSWSPGVSGNTVSSFVAMWRHVYNIFAVVNGLDSNHVQWVYTVSASDHNATGTIENLYPGSSYTNWVGVDGYLRYSTDTASSIFDTAISRLNTLSSNKPIFIVEFGIQDSVGAAVKKSILTRTYLKNNES
jgi:hypothetical protein